MGVNLIPEGKSEADITWISALLNSFTEVMDIVRYHGLSDVSEDIARVYCVLSGNNYMLNQVYNHEGTIVTEYRNELSVFIERKLIIFIKTILRAINSNDIVGCGKKATWDQFPSMTSDLFIAMKDLQLIEFAILQKCEHASHLCGPHGSEAQSLDSSTLANLPEILKALLTRFGMVSDMILGKSDERSVPSCARIKCRIEDEMASMDVVILLGHLIARVAKSLLAVKMCRSVDYEKHNNVVGQRLVLEEFAQYSNLGSMTKSGIVCCFGNEILLPIMVSKPNNTIGSTEKKLLLNMLVASKLTRNLQTSVWPNSAA